MTRVDRSQLPETFKPYFNRDGVLIQLPRRQERRVALLRYLARVFAPGERYSEPQVNSLLGGHEIDHATLRRAMIDETILLRDHGVYWLAPEPA